MSDPNLSAIALRHFRAFAAAVDTGTVTAASERIRRSPSSISRSIAILETACGAELLTRARNGVTANTVGGLVAARCSAIQAELNSCRNMLLQNFRQTLRSQAAFLEMQPDLAHLRAVIAVHDSRSVQRAADMLGVSQPAISYSLRLMESDLGVGLFSRLRTGTSPTLAGTTVTITARRVLSEISKLVDDVRSADGVSTGLVRVGALPYSRAAILPKAIKLVLSQNEAVSVRTVEGPIELLMTALHSDQIDAVICAHPDQSFLEGVAIEPIIDDPLGFFVSHEHPLALRRNLSLTELLNHPFILPPEGSVTRQLLENCFLNAGCQIPRGRAETSSSSLIRSLVLDSDFVAFRSLREFWNQLHDDRIVRLDIDAPQPSRSICILRREGVQPTVAIRDFLAAVQSAQDH